SPTNPAAARSLGHQPSTTKKTAGATQTQAAGDADRTCAGKVSAAVARPSVKDPTGRSVRELKAAIVMMIHVVQPPLCRHAARAGHHHTAPAMAPPLAIV